MFLGNRIHDHLELVGGRPIWLRQPRLFHVCDPGPGAGYTNIDRNEYKHYHSDPDSDGHADGHSDVHTAPNPNPDLYGVLDSNAHRDSYLYANTDGNGDPITDLFSDEQCNRYRDTSSNTNPFRDSHRDPYGESNPDADRITHADLNYHLNGDTYLNNDPDRYADNHSHRNLDRDSDRESNLYAHGYINAYEHPDPDTSDNIAALWAQRWGILDFWTIAHSNTDSDGNCYRDSNE